MTTITFNCPSCGYLCAFKDVYAGRRAKCLRCNQVFVIPDSDGQKAKKVIPPKEYDEPLPGYYEAVLKNSWRAIFNFQSLPVLIFIVFLTVVKFYTFHMNYAIPFFSIVIYLPIGWIIAFFVYGGLFWCYAEIVCATAFDVEALPEISFGEGIIGYIATAFKTLYSFAMALFIVLLPAIVFIYIFRVAGIHNKFAIIPFYVLAAFLFPMALMIVTISRDLMLLARPVYFFTPIKKAFRHYLFLTALFLFALFLHDISPIYKDVINRNTGVIYANILAAIAIQIPAIVSMRAAGLFYRHFACYFKW